MFTFLLDDPEILGSELFLLKTEAFKTWIGNQIDLTGRSTQMTTIGSSPSVKLTMIKIFN